MDKNCREQNIKAIIKLESRIALCNRCPKLLKCTSKPSLGKGDLEPEALVVFECESAQTQDSSWIIGLRRSIQKYLAVNSVYHTFLVRCQPKSCTCSYTNAYGLTSKLIDRNDSCILINQSCDGIPIRPCSEEVINCLNFLIEEIEIFKPKYVILFGKRVSDFVLKSYGVMEPYQDQQLFGYEGATFIRMIEEKASGTIEIEKLEMALTKEH